MRGYDANLREVDFNALFKQATKKEHLLYKGH